MKYKITQQYAKGEEQLIASFLEENEALFFIEKKILSDSEKHTTIIYRLFDGQKLFQTFNKEKMNCVIRRGRYESLDQDLPSFIGPFSVSKENAAIYSFATFSDLNNAEFFVEEKLIHPNNKKETTYYIFEKNALIRQMDQHVKKKLLDNESNQGKGQSSSFRPTPLNTTPRPPGSPHTWIKDNGGTKDDEKNK